MQWQLGERRMMNQITLDEAIKNPVGYWLIACFAYDILSESIMSDDTFDKLCLHIQENYDTIIHPHKWILDKEVIKNKQFKSSLHTVIPLSNIPQIIKNSASTLLIDLKHKNDAA